MLNQLRTLSKEDREEGNLGEPLTAEGSCEKFPSNFRRGEAREGFGGGKRDAWTGLGSRLAADHPLKGEPLIRGFTLRLQS
jgi:hypothetical protein